MRSCQDEECPKRANYNYDGYPPLFCAGHKSTNMVNIYSKQCLKCPKIPTFNEKGQNIPLYCLQHKSESMVDVCNRQCLKCTKRPTFNDEGQTTPLYCGSHKTKSMVNVVDRQCLKCPKRANYNYDGYPPLFCAGHKSTNMVLIGKRRCLKCPKQPTFNDEGQTIPLYCKKHKSDDMVDVKNSHCSFNHCPKRPHYGIPGNLPTRCAPHKLAGQIPFPKTRCKTSGCQEISIYASTQKRADHCEEHKEIGEINIVEQKCNSCGLPNIVNEDGLCTYCDPVHFNGFRLAKQLRIKSWLDNTTDFKYSSYDSAINYKSCGDRERPDFVFESPSSSHVVILEVDEEQHNSRNDLCECTRMVNISQSLGIPTLFIRYNPDPYKIGRKRYDPTFHARMKLLKVELETTIHLPVGKLTGFCSVNQLYFDNFDGSISWDIISPFES